MERYIVTLIVFIVIYLLYLFTVLNNKEKMANFEHSGQGAFIIKKYQLNISLLNKKKFARSIAFVNSVIIALTFFFTDFLQTFILKLFIGFLILLPSIMIGYHFIGIIYKKKEGK